MTKLLDGTKFPWLLSNVVDVNTGTTPPPLRKYWITERGGLKIGIIGLVEQCVPVALWLTGPRDWIQTIPSWPESFEYRPMIDVALDLSKELRDPQGENCDLVIALTHMRLPNVSVALRHKLTLGHCVVQQARCSGATKRAGE